MNTEAFAPVLAPILRELYLGSPDRGTRTFVLNQGDAGLLGSLERISAAAASAAHGGGAPIAAHVDHLRYGLSLLNRWASGAAPPWPAMDWGASWRIHAVTDAEWRALRDALKREADAWAAAVRAPREVTEVEAGWIIGSVAHLAYHLGAIRQIDRATRGPSAEDEARAQAESRGA